MLLNNDVIEYAGTPNRVIRILWIDQQRDLAYTFELGCATAWPRPVALASLVADLQARRARLLLTDPFRAHHPQDPPEHHLQLQANAWNAVRTLHERLPDVYLRAARAKAVAEYARRHGMSRANIMRYLRRYWERGQTPEALLPDYANSGARGKARVATGGVKRGRPSKRTVSGPNVDAAMRATFQTVVARYTAAHAAFSRRAAYRDMLAEYFAGASPDAIPSYGQFIYWLERDGYRTVQEPLR